jgi:2-methylcitrate dehydratase PrpD
MNTRSSIELMMAIAALDGKTIPKAARQFATLSLFDWMVVARAGVEEPVGQIIRNFVEDEGGKPVATMAGSNLKVPARAAALANGTISHALDYDDTHFAHIGHPSVGIYPAALAAGEQAGASAADVRDAFLLGAEASCRIGMVLGRGHYQRGFHQTATAGAFGATIAAGRIFGLTPIQMQHALSLVSTRASGLKSQFGTMGKPFNAGMAAANGVEAASLAKRGFISCDDGVTGLQGFVDTHSDAPDYDSPWKDPPPRSFVFEDIKYKLHACCHGTHAMIEALLEAQRQQAFKPDEIASIEVHTHPRWLRVCDIKEPRTGLEAKFSYGLLAAIVLHGLDTSSEKTYTDALAADPALKKLASRMAVKGDEGLSDTAARVVIEAGDKRVKMAHDLAKRLPPDVLESKLRVKAKGLLGEANAERLWSGIESIDKLSARELAKLLNDA